MPLTNIFRAFGDDALLIAVLCLPLVLAYIAVRSRALKARFGYPGSVATLEALIAVAFVGVLAVTLIPSEAAADGPPSVDWSVLGSDLTYAPERTQALGNLILFLPLMLGLAVRLPAGPVRLAVVALALPAIVETLQYALVAGRASTVEDWLLGAVGGLIGIFLGTRMSMTRWVGRRLARRKFVQVHAGASAIESSRL